MSFPPQLAQALLPTYVVQGALGEGAMGWVVRATDQSVGREVAIKVSRKQGTPQQLARFEREGRIAGGLTHTNIVRTHTLGNVGGHAFLVMELVPSARTLRDVFREEPVPQRLNALRDVVAAMAYAHEQGVVHRDLKPENVLVDSMGRGRVTDFGVATMQGLERMTQSGALVGTPHYMAPEQLGGKRAQVGPHTDVWALGVMLYEAVNGKRPFSGDTLFELVDQVSRGTPPSRLQPGAPPAMLAVLRRALAPKVAERFPDAGAMLVALDAGLAGRVQRDWKPVWVVGGLSALVLCAAVGVVAALRGGGQQEQTPTAPPRPAGAEEWEAIQAQPPGELLEAGEAWLQRFPRSTLRREVAAELEASRLAAPRWVYREHRTPVRMAATSERLAAVDEAGRVSLAPWGEPREAVRVGAEAMPYLASSPAGDELWIAAPYHGQGSLLRVEAGEQPPTFEQAGRSLVQRPALLTLSADGALLAFCHGERTSLYAAEAMLAGGFGRNQLGWIKQTMTPVAQAFLPHGSAFASVTGEGTTERLDSLIVLSLETYEVQGSADLPVIPTSLVALADGRLVIGSRGGHLLLFDAHGAFLGVIKDPALPPRAKGSRGNISDIYDGRANDGAIRALALGPQGRLYTVGEAGSSEGSAIRVWDVAAGTLLREQRVPRPYRAACLSADGRYLACATDEGAIEVWDRWLSGEWRP